MGRLPSILKGLWALGLERQRVPVGQGIWGGHAGEGDGVGVRDEVKGAGEPRAAAERGWAWAGDRVQHVCGTS